MTYPKGDVLSGQVAVVTAGCAGIGAEISQHLASLGATVIATSRSDERVQRCVEQLTGSGVEPRQLVFEDQAIAKFVDGVAADFGGLHILVNAAAGRSGGVAVERLKPETFLDELKSTLITGFLCSQAVAVRQKQTAVQSIVNIGSIYGVLAVDHRIYDNPERQTPLSYACAKAGVVQMTRYLAACWAGRGIRVNCVSVGGIRRNQDDAFLKKYGSRVPMERMAEPQEVANAVGFLASPQSSYITGENLMVDGGLHIW